MCKEAEIAAPEDEDELWDLMVENDLFPTLPYWLEGNAAQHAIDNAISVIEQRFSKWLKPKL